MDAIGLMARTGRVSAFLVSGGVQCSHTISLGRRLGFIVLWLGLSFDRRSKHWQPVRCGSSVLFCDYSEVSHCVSSCTLLTSNCLRASRVAPPATCCGPSLTYSPQWDTFSGSMTAIQESSTTEPGSKVARPKNTTGTTALQFKLGGNH